ncbi:MAG: hypothetical protein FJX18_02020 [Alphaproteobacteria bacterium]|nr:hypothetical protein [Alphaproteobacteria bacterium]
MIQSFLAFLILIATTTIGSLVPVDIVTQHSKGYSCEELTLIKEDLNNIDRLLFRGKKPSKHPFYIATAGGPGACKSTILETLLHEDPSFKNVVYVDPDPQSLRLMINTYLTKSLSFYAISKKESFAKAQMNAYNYWRGGSNYIACTLLNKAFDKRFNIAHGTTSTSPAVENLYKTLKANGYKIYLVLCYAEPETRANAIAHRSVTQANYQVTPEDAVEKGKVFPERFPIYFKYADSLRFYWTCDFSTGSKEVARIENKSLKIFDKSGYETFVEQYTKERAAAGNTWPAWEELLKIQEIES